MSSQSTGTEKSPEISVEVKTLFQDGTYAKMVSAHHGQFYLFLPLFVHCKEPDNKPKVGDTFRITYLKPSREVLTARRIA